MEMRDLYKDLGVPPTATAEEIRRAFRRIAATEHPDVRQGRGQPPESEAFLYAVLAHDLLTDPEKLAAYDRMRRDSERGVFDKAGFQSLLVQTVQNLAPEFAALRAAAQARKWLDLAFTTGTIGLGLLDMARGARALVSRFTGADAPPAQKPASKMLAQKAPRRGER